VTVTATDSGGLATSETFEISVGDVNEAPTDIALDNLSVDENAEGATVGSLTTTDVDAGDTATYAVSDDRFEVVDGDLKLKDGVSLNHEEADSVSVTVTATDSGGLTTSETFEISVGDVNEAPTDIALDNLSVDENAEGATVGSLTTTDVDAGDTASYAVSDDRFEVVDGDLKLKDGVSLNHEEVDSVSVTVTATDSGGLTTSEAFEISVGDVNEAPTDIALEGAAETSTTVTVTFESEDAGHDNTLGVYYADESGNPVAGEVIWSNGNDLDAGDTASVTFDGVEASAIGYFLIPDGDDENDNITDGMEITFGLDGNGNWQVLFEGEPLAGNGANVYFSGDSSLNIDGADHTLESGDTIYFEDLYNNGDADFGDMVFTQSISETIADEISVTENVEGDVVGVLSSSDPDAGDTATYTVSDDRFEVVDGNLKLKEGVSLDYEDADTVSVTVTATDSGGLTTSEEFDIAVNDVAEGPVTLWSEDFTGLSDGAESDAGDTAWSTDDSDAMSGASHGVENEAYEFGDSSSSSNSDEHLTWSSEEIDISGQDSLTLNFDLQSEGGLDDSGSWQDHFTVYVVIDGVREEVFEQLGGDNGTVSHELTGLGTGDTLVIEFEAKTTGSSEYYTLDNIQLIGGSDSDSESADTAPTWDWTGTMPTTASEEHSTDENIDGSKHNDTLYGNSNNENIDGGKGSDYIDGGAGHDTIDGGDKSDVIYGGAGDDTIDGGKGNHGDTIYGGDGNDTIDGEKGNDYIQGDDGDDVIFGGEGEDTIYGGDGNDAMDGGEDADYLSGGDGNDLILGGEDSDQLYGNDGNDVMVGGEDDDYLSGGEGSDLFIYQDGDGSDTVLGGAGWTDTISLQGDDGGTMSGDWTVTITSGSTTDSGDGYMNLSDDADGYVSLEGGETISFQDIERIEW